MPARAGGPHADRRRGAGGRVLWEELTPAHMMVMTTPSTALAPAIQESAQPERLFWRTPESSGECTWLEARSMIACVGHDPGFVYLILHAEDGPGLPGTFAQCTGGGPDFDLLVEIGYGDTVGIVALAGVGTGQLIWITQDEPWCRSAADHRVLLPTDAMAAIAYVWITGSRLDPAYELRPVEDYETPLVFHR